MKLPTFSTSIAASALVCLLSADAFAQDTITSRKSDEARQLDRNRPGTTSMKDVDEAYRHLHDATMKSLNDAARTFYTSTSTEDGDEMDDEMDTDKETHGSMALDDGELIIGVCSKGLIAGAPIGQATTTTSASARSDDPSVNRREQSADGEDSSDSTSRSMDGRTIGMVLIHEASSKPSERLGATRMNDRTADRTAKASTTSLSAGVYAVKHSGTSVWLVGKNGVTAARTTLESSKTSMNDRENTTSSGTHSNGVAWHDVFAALSKEAMKSMEWDGASSSDRLGSGTR